MGIPIMISNFMVHFIFAKLTPRECAEIHEGSFKALRINYLFLDQKVY